MRKIFGIIFFSIFLFLIEIALFQIFGLWFKPNLLVIFIIFVNLRFGLRYGVFVSLFCGILADSFSAGIFGVHIISFIICSYILAIVKKYFLQFDALSFKLVIAFVFSSLFVLLMYFFNAMFLKINFSGVFTFIFLPEVAATVAVSPLCFDWFKKCDSKLLN